VESAGLPEETILPDGTSDATSDGSSGVADAASP
jgi:hypothetical protein